VLARASETVSGAVTALNLTLHGNEVLLAVGPFHSDHARLVRTGRLSLYWLVVHGQDQAHGDDTELGWDGSSKAHGRVLNPLGGRKDLALVGNRFFDGEEVPVSCFPERVASLDYHSCLYYSCCASAVIPSLLAGVNSKRTRMMHKYHALDA
jgi:hypothetical protein